jgi:hypothetical protein
MIISIDVGIKNLSLCKLDSQATIQLWEVIDLSQENHSATCEHIGKKGKCKHHATYTVADKHFFCNLHIKKSEYSQHIAPLYYYKMLTKKISQKTLLELNTFYSLEDNTQEQLKEHIYNINATKIPKSISASEIDLIQAGITMSKKITDCLDDFSNITTVLIENQISPIATRMKCVQGMITQFFIEKGVHDIHFISSSNKLKAYDVPKKTYKERKKSCIVVTEDLLTKDKNNKKWISIFKNNKKKDDLADSYLQGVWYINYSTT